VAAERVNKVWRAHREDVLEVRAAQRVRGPIRVAGQNQLFVDEDYLGVEAWA